MDYTLRDLADAIDHSGRKVKWGNRYLLVQCLTHDDRTPSAQVFPDGWVSCHSGCGRYHISTIFKEFRDTDYNKELGKPIMSSKPPEEKRNYKKYDLFETWENLPLIPRDHEFKTIPLEVLDGLGWRFTNNDVPGMGKGYFMPYFNAKKDSIPFAQTRHLEGERRFTMLPEAEMILYGRWNIEKGGRLFIVEGPSDAAVMEYAMIPWISIPSASQTGILVKFAQYCLKNGINLIYGGDNDSAGEKLKEALDSVAPYRICQPPKEFKDWGDFLVAKGVGAILEHCGPEIHDVMVEPILGLAQEVFDVAKEGQNELGF